MTIAEKFNPASIVGIDIDKRLIDAATSSVKRALYNYRVMKKNQDQVQNSQSERFTSSSLVPRNIVLNRLLLKPAQPISQPNIDNNSGKFPFNIQFEQADIMNSSSGVSSSSWGVILCMSLTKWIHLNHGDSGLISFFQRLFAMSCPGGRVIIEYQPWKSYIKNRNASDHIKETFKTIKIQPQDFESILSNDIGFRIEYRLGTPLDRATGFNRPILVLIKPLPQLAQVTTVIRSHDRSKVYTDALTTESTQEKTSSSDLLTGRTDIFGIKRSLQHSGILSYTTNDISSSSSTAPKRLRLFLDESEEDIIN